MNISATPLALKDIAITVRFVYSVQVAQRFRQTSCMLHSQVLKLAQDLGSLQRQVAQGQAAQLSHQKVSAS